MITWRASKYSTWYGSVGGIELFSVVWASTRHADGLMQVLGTKLPGVVLKNDRYATVEDAQSRAEKVLSDWLARVSGAGSGSPTLADQCRANALEAIRQLPAVDAEFHQSFGGVTRRALADMLQDPEVLDAVLRIVQAHQK